MDINIPQLIPKNSSIHFVCQGDNYLIIQSTDDPIDTNTIFCNYKFCGKEISEYMDTLIVMPISEESHFFVPQNIFEKIKHFPLSIIDRSYHFIGCQ